MVSQNQPEAMTIGLKEQLLDAHSISPDTFLVSATNQVLAIETNNRIIRDMYSPQEYRSMLNLYLDGISQILDNEQAQILTNNNNQKLAVWNISGGMHEEMGNQLKQFLTPLAKIYAKIFADEWGEEIKPEEFLEEISSLGQKDTLVLSCYLPDSNSPPIPIGAAIAKLRTKQDLSNDICTILNRTIGTSLSQEDLTAALPERAIYWAEVFIHKAFRSGIEPYRTISERLLNNYATEDSKDLPIIMVTKGHRSLSLSDKQEAQEYLFTKGITSEHSADILSALDDMDLVSIERILRASDKKNTNMDVLEFLNTYIEKRKTLSVMNTARALRMKNIEIPQANKKDRYIFSIPVNQLHRFVSQTNRGMLVLTAAYINLINRLNK